MKRKVMDSNDIKIDSSQIISLKKDHSFLYMINNFELYNNTSNNDIYYYELYLNSLIANKSLKQLKKQNVLTNIKVNTTSSNHNVRLMEFKLIKSLSLLDISFFDNFNFDLFYPLLSQYQLNGFILPKAKKIYLYNAKRYLTLIDDHKQIGKQQLLLSDMFKYLSVKIIKI